MALLQRADVRPPVLRKETAPAPGLGGDVVVCGLLLSDRLALDGIKAAMAQPLPGETEEQAARRAGSAIVFETLARTVVIAGDQQPVFDAAGWNLHGASHPDDVLSLYRVAWRLSGYEEAATEKN